MLGKLLKYDLKWVYKEVVVFYILALIFSLIGRGISYIENSVVFSVTTGIMYGIAIGLMIGSVINCMMRLWARFLKNLYKDESYLTHTLPVKKKTIYTSKAITAIITLFTTVAVIVGCIAICFYSETNIQILKEALEIVASTYDITMIKIIVLMALICFMELVFIVSLGYVGIVIGHKANRNKMIYSVVTAFVSYMITQITTLVIVMLFGVLNSEIMNLINTTEMIDTDIIKYLLCGAIGLYVIYNIIFYMIGRKQLEKGVNIE